MIPETPPPGASEGMKLLDPQTMVPNRFQPRESFADQAIEALAESIRRDGLLQPIVVRPLDGGYEIIAGERRWRAAVRAGLKRVPSIVQAVAEDRALELALVENLQREDLDPIEEARAFKILGEKFGMTQERIAGLVGKSRPAVANSLRLLKLPADIQELLKERTLTRGHARALLSAGDPATIRKLARKFQEESLSVRSAEEAVRPVQGRASKQEHTAEDPNVRAAQERLQKRLGTRVKVHCNAKGRGKIEIQFGSQEELSRLFDGLMSGTY